jgi:neutral ceramidase
VTTDLIGLPSMVSDAVARRLKEKFQLERSELLLNSSHTHSGPVVRPNLKVLYDLSPEDDAIAARYSAKLTEDLVAVVEAAFKDLAPADLASAHGSVSFGTNRREATPSGMRIGVNPSGPTDPDVPIMRVTHPDGRMRAIVFGYACHNTTLGGDSYRIHGDYAGFAQIELEQRYPGTTAMFVMLCGADQNPNPRGTIDHAQKYGLALASTVDQALHGVLHPVKAPLRTAYREVALQFAPHSRETFVQESKSTDKYRQRRARLMLAEYERGHPVQKVAYPIQAIRLGTDLTLLVLGGEVVIDYALRAKREYPGQNLIVAGYSNEVMCYIPSARVLKEGGYEPVESMIYYGQPGPFQANVEETAFRAIHQVLKSVGIKPGT